MVMSDAWICQEYNYTINTTIDMISPHLQSASLVRGKKGDFDLMSGHQCLTQPSMLLFISWI